MTASCYWWRGLCFCLLSFALAFALRMAEWPSWQNPEFRLGQEWLLATHDAYHWVAGAEGVGRAVDHPMATMLSGMASLLHTTPAAVAFWFPAVLSSCVAMIVFAWVWALGSMEAGIAAGLLTSLSPGFMARTLLGFYDTDLVTLFFPLLMTLAPACWAMRHIIVPHAITQRLNQRLVQRLAAHLGQHPGFADDAPGNPLRPLWVVLLGLSGLVSWWTQGWHSVFPYLIRYNVLLLFLMGLCLPRPQRRSLLLLGGLSHALPALLGPAGLLFSVLLLVGNGHRHRGLLRVCTRPAVLVLLWLVAGALVLGGDIAQTLLNQVNAYLKHSGDVKSAGGGVSLTYPSVAQSIVEVQDLTLANVFAYFHPWREAAMAGLAGFCLVLVRRPGAFFLLPLAALALLSTKLGGRMVMFGAPVVAIGLTLPLFWLLRRLLPEARRHWSGLLCGVLILGVLVAPFLHLIPAMSQGPMINRRHADALTRAATVTPPDAMLWLWWDWGYAAHHFARRTTIADGALHGGPSLYLPAAVLATDNPRFARQLMRHTARCGNDTGKVFEGLDNTAAQALMDQLRSADTPLVESQGKLYLVVSFEMLRLGFWISNFGNWNFVTGRGEGGALSIVPQALAYKLDTGEVRLADGTSSVEAASITVFDETGLTRRDYVSEWFAAHPLATSEEQDAFLQRRRNVHFLLNRVTDEKLAVDERIYNSLMVQLLLCDTQDERFAPYFRLVYDNVFARIYEVL